MVFYFGTAPSPEPPRSYGTVAVSAGHRIGYAEFGDPDGHPVFWLHGTPGAARQVAPAAAKAASERGLRIIGISRPGVGESSTRRYEAIVDFAPDLIGVADAFDVDRFAVVGLSGGGPYALGVAHEAPDRVAGVGVLGGVAPTVGPDAPEGGITQVCRRVEGKVSALQTPLNLALTGAIHIVAPLANPVYAIVSRVMPVGDRAVFETPGVKDMFIDDLVRGVTQGGADALLRDLVLFGRDWGFRVADVGVAVRWWHGDDDSIVPLEHGRHVAGLLSKVVFTEVAGGAHLSGYAAADEVIEATASFFD